MKCQVCLRDMVRLQNPLTITNSQSFTSICNDIDHRLELSFNGEFLSYVIFRSRNFDFEVRFSALEGKLSIWSVCPKYSNEIDFKSPQRPSSLRNDEILQIVSNNEQVSAIRNSRIFL
jgi:hypothetical protein